MDQIRIGTQQFSGIRGSRSLSLLGSKSWKPLRHTRGPENACEHFEIKLLRSKQTNRPGSLG